MPSRPYSTLIIGGLWPMSDPQSWLQSGQALHQKGQHMHSTAADIRHSANSVVSEGQSGRTIDGFVDACHRNARTVTSHGDHYFDMAGAANEIARLIDGLHQDLDQIDEEANDEIQRIMSSGGGALTAAAQAAMLNAVVAQARAAATEKHTVAAAAIASQSATIAGGAVTDV